MKKKLILYLFLSSFFTVHLTANQSMINMNTLLSQSSKDNKYIMVFFHINNCIYCKRMESKTLQNEVIKNTIKKDFIFLDVNTDETDKIIIKNKRYSTKEFANKHDVHFFPTVLFIDSENEVIYKARGYRDILTFKKILTYISSNMFEEMSFFEYSEKRNSPSQDKE